ncbi:hypothetical protein [Paraburkholderia silvatlantica]|uniref:hypothetical protein n=1 Tax=Paraburkholderia silvatlantica TaxID=321895 RepID=UPI00375228BE
MMLKASAAGLLVFAAQPPMLAQPSWARSADRLRALLAIAPNAKAEKNITIIPLNWINLNATVNHLLNTSTHKVNCGGARQGNQLLAGALNNF